MVQQLIWEQIISIANNNTEDDIPVFTNANCVNILKSDFFCQVNQVHDKIRKELAGDLEQDGVQRVCIDLGNSIEYVVVVCATLKLGCAFVPLSQKCPVRRKHMIIRETQPLCIVSSNPAFLKDFEPEEFLIISTFHIFEKEIFLIQVKT
eukprot:TRINITY_DN6116_c1_g1_i5.p3 TRINITY_DN6116_c1_g1~~TRINITY_DN6116_c1_g1_i5.p3  ORF type:complete len:150 (+),score=7.10 TRINITY_DN6116_c1_g1_i5:165-614(+)